MKWFVMIFLPSFRPKTIVCYWCKYDIEADFELEPNFPNSLACLRKTYQGFSYINFFLLVIMCV